MCEYRGDFIPKPQVLDPRARSHGTFDTAEGALGRGYITLSTGWRKRGSGSAGGSTCRRRKTKARAVGRSARVECAASSVRNGSPSGACGRHGASEVGLSSVKAPPAVTRRGGSARSTPKGDKLACTGGESYRSRWSVIPPPSSPGPAGANRAGPVTKASAPLDDARSGARSSKAEIETRSAGGS